MPQELSSPKSGTSPMRAKTLPSGSPTERFALHAWVLVILVALLWVLLR
jgi:hypothetical protein